MTTTSAKKTYRDDIDGMRALAVLAVIVNHFHHAALPGGYLGVDVFFVISGYVITNSLERTELPALGEQLSTFYARRIKRLMPALVVMVLVASAAIRLFDPNALVSTLTGIASLFGLSNLFLFTQATNYFGHSAERNMFSHTWSLGVEEQFYLLYPLLFRLKKVGLHGRRLCVVVLAVLSAVSLGAFVLEYGMNQPAAYFLMPCRFFELGAGCLLAFAGRGLKISGRLAKLPPVLGLVLMVPSLVFADVYPVASTILVVVASVVLLGSSRPGTGTNTALSAKVPVYLGRISYSLYLWHWPVICLSRWTVGIHAWTLPFQIALIAALSTASYHLLEKPLRTRNWAGGRRGVIAMGVTAMGVAATLVFLGQRHEWPRFAGDRTAEATLDSPEPGYVAKYSQRRIDDCFASSLFGANGDRADGPELSDAVAKCTAGEEKLHLIFVGDSHAMDMFPMADELYREHVAMVTNVFQPGCKVPPTQGEGALCNFAERLIKVFANDKTHTNVLVMRVNSSPRKLNGDLRNFSVGMEALLHDAAAAKIKVIYIDPAPKFSSVGPESLCAPQWYRPVSTMSAECRTGFLENRGEQLARRADMVEYLQQLSARNADLLVFDPFDTLCGSATGDCTPIRNGRQIYRDDSHITAEGSEMLAKPFVQFLAAQGLIAATGSQ